MPVFVALRMVGREGSRWGKPSTVRNQSKQERAVWEQKRAQSAAREIEKGRRGAHTFCTVWIVACVLGAAHAGPIGGVGVAACMLNPSHRALVVPRARLCRWGRAGHSCMGVCVWEREGVSTWLCCVLMHVVRGLRHRFF